MEMLLKRKSFKSIHLIRSGKVLEKLLSGMGLKILLVLNQSIVQLNFLKGLPQMEEFI